MSRPDASDFPGGIPALVGGICTVGPATPAGPSRGGWAGIGGWGSGEAPRPQLKTASEAFDSILRSNIEGVYDTFIVIQYHVL